MNKIRSLLTFSLCAVVLAACTLPSATQPAPALLTQPTAVIEQPIATALPTDQPAQPATQTNPPGQPVVISQIHMLDAANGWGWTSKDDGSADLLRTADGGSTWTSASPQDKAINPYNGFFLDAQTAWIPYFDPASSTSSLLHTSDGGKTWVSLPPVESAQNALYEFSNATEGVAQTAGLGAGNLYLNLYQTKDGGQSWAPILITPPSPEPGLPAGTVHLCNICADNLYYDSARAVIAYGDMANDPADAVRVAVSTDLGQHWQDIKLALPDEKYKDGLIGPKPMKFFGPEGVLPVNIIKYNPDGGLEYSVLALYSTQDGGQTWSAAPARLENTSGQYDSVQILSPKDAFVRCGRNLCSTNDGAQTWQTLPDSLNFDMAQGGPDYVSLYSFVSPTTGWAISGENPATTLWKTTDGGASWVALSTTLAP